MESGEWKMNGDMPAKSNFLKDKSYDFALQVVLLCRRLAQEKREFVLSRQLLRSGTSIGANIEEANQAQSKVDFIHKLSIAHKEAFETHYWLRLLRDSNYLEGGEAQPLLADCEQIQKMLTSSLKTSKSSIARN
jgi:four helix bundle protein